MQNRPLRQQEPAFAWITLALDVSRQLAIILSRQFDYTSFGTSWQGAYFLYQKPVHYNEVI